MTDNTATKEVQVVVDLDNLTIGDLPLLERLGRDELTAEEVVDFLDGVIEGGVKHLPLRYMPEITAAFREATAEILGTPEEQKN
jgi:hypothetical protein